MTSAVGAVLVMSVEKGNAVVEIAALRSRDGRAIDLAAMRAGTAVVWVLPFGWGLMCPSGRRGRYDCG